MDRGPLALREGRPADAHVATGRRIVEDIAASIVDDQLREGFLRQPLQLLDGRQLVVGDGRRWRA